MPKTPLLGTYEVDLLSKSEYAQMFCLFFFCFADRYSRRKCFAFTPYGMKINELKYNATGVRYGYNGTHEQDKELNADGNYLDFGNFGYDTRVAMRRNQEPLSAKYPHLSTYSILNSNPIIYSDPDGLDKWATMFIVKQLNSKLLIVSSKTSKSSKEYGFFAIYEKKGNKYTVLPIVTLNLESGLYIERQYYYNNVNYESHTIIVRAHGHPQNTPFSYGDIYTLTNNRKPLKKEDDLPARFSIVETENTRYVLEVNDRAKAYDIYYNKIGGYEQLSVIMNTVEKKATDDGIDPIRARELAILEIVKIYEGSLSFYKSVDGDKNILEEVR